jgi:predicted glycosyltransferase involved in capsule biosynthesis
MKTMDVPTILIPFREQVEQKRGEQLQKFIKHMKRWHADWTIIIIEQSDDGRKFNRGALLNIGTLYAQKLNKEYVIYHDVDLIPLSPLVVFYKTFPEHPIHIGSAYTGKYQGDNFIGQVLSMSLTDILATNGYPNNFWGWGGEDDALRRRLKKHNIDVYRPTLTSGFKVLEHKDTRLIPEAKNMRKWEDLKEDNGESGIKNVKWKLLSKEESGNILKLKVEVHSPI